MQTNKQTKTLILQINSSGRLWLLAPASTSGCRMNLTSGAFNGAASPAVFQRLDHLWRSRYLVRIRNTHNWIKALATLHRSKEKNSLRNFVNLFIWKSRQKRTRWHISNNASYWHAWLFYVHIQCRHLLVDFCSFSVVVMEKYQWHIWHMIPLVDFMARCDTWHKTARVPFISVWWGFQNSTQGRNVARAPSGWGLLGGKQERNGSLAHKHPFMTPVTGRMHSFYPHV